MKAALVVVQVCSDAAENLGAVCQATNRAAEAGCRLVLFGEAVLTGLVNRDDPAHDLPLGEPIPGPATAAVGRVAAANGIYVGLGLLERDDRRLYDSAALLGPNGDLLLHYRRIQPDWHGRRADDRVYRQGRIIPQAQTELGRVAFLICGDLFDDEVVSAAHALEPDLLLYPFWRTFDDGSVDDLRWQLEEAEDYGERVAEVGAPTLMVSSLGPQSPQGGAFGGAFALDACGRTVDRLPLGREGMLIVEVPHAGRQRKSR